MATSDVVTLTTCPVCAGDRFQTLPTPGRWIGPEVFEPLRGRIGMMDCRDCGLAFVNPRPSSERLGAFYSGNTYDCHETSGSSSAGDTADFLMSRIQPHLPAGSPKSVLDYGAGGGGFLLRMRELGWRTQGLEPGLRGLAACRAAGLDVTDEVDELPSGAYGLVTFHHVFEHLEDPASVLDTVRRVLAPDGRLFIEVPNYDSLRARLALPVLSRSTRVDERFRAYPIHLAYYTADTLSRVLANSGWQVDATFTVGMGLDEYLASGSPSAEHDAPAHASADADTEAAPPAHATQAAADAQVEAPVRPRKLPHLVRDAYLDMGLGENLAVIARPG